MTIYKGLIKNQRVMVVFALSCFLGSALSWITDNQIKKRSWRLAQEASKRLPFQLSIGSAALDWTGTLNFSNVVLGTMGSTANLRVVPKRNGLFPTQTLSHIVFHRPLFDFSDTNQTLKSFLTEKKKRFSPSQSNAKTERPADTSTSFKNVPIHFEDAKITWNLKDTQGSIQNIQGTSKDNQLTLSAPGWRGAINNKFGSFDFTFNSLNIKTPLNNLEQTRALSLEGTITERHSRKNTTLRNVVMELNVEDPGVVLYGSTSEDSNIRLNWQSQSTPMRLTVGLQSTPIRLFRAFLPKGTTEQGTLSGSFDVLFSKETHLSGNVLMNDVAVYHKSLSDSMVELNGELSGSLSMRNTSKDVLGIFENISLNTDGLHLEASGSFRKDHNRSWPDNWLSSLKLHRTTCQNVFKNLPDSFKQRVLGTELKGDIAAMVELSYDQDKGESVIDLDIDNGCTVKKPSPLSNIQKTFDIGVFSLPSGDVVHSKDFTRLNKLPKHVYQAFVSTEDGRFFRHEGFDLHQIERSLVVNAKKQHFIRGGSTISQQLVKNIFLGHERHFARKSEEALLTWQLEKAVPKEKILETYLNIVQLAPKDVHGLNQAANAWFDKPPSQLTVTEAAFLAALTREPTSMPQRIKKNNGLDSKSKRNTVSVLNALKRDDVIASLELKEAKIQLKKMTFDLSSNVFSVP